MPNLRGAAVICILCAGAGGCASHATQPSSVPLGRSFELRTGTSAALQDGLEMTFNAVKSDSRCPMDVVCFWAGDASVVIRLSRTAGGQAERELHTNPAAGEAEASYLTYVIKLVALEPYPRSDRPIRPEDYVATLLVERR